MGKPSKQAVCIGLVTLAFIGLHPLAGTVCAAEESPSGSEARLHIRQLGAESGGRAFIKTDFPVRPSASLPISFQAEIFALKDLGAINARFEILDQSGKPLAEVSIKTSVPAGSTPLQFTWDARKHPDGKYTGAIEIVDSLARVLARQAFVLTKRSRSEVDAALESARNALAELSPYGTLERNAPSLAGSLAIAKEALSRAGESRDDWFVTYDLAEYVSETADRLRARWTLGKSAADANDFTEPLSLAGLRWADGGLKAQEKPVFLGGLASLVEIEYLERVSNFGLNFAAVRATGVDALPELESILDKAAAKNIALLGLIDSDAFSSNDSTALGSGPSSDSALFAIALTELPPIDITSLSVRNGFIEFAKRAYKDRYELNMMWRKRFRGFHEIEVWPDYKRHAYQFDWQTYHWDLKSRYALDSVKELRASWLQVPVTFALDDPLLVNGSTRQGIDSETLSRASQIGLLATASPFEDPVFGIRYPGPIMLQALRRSFAPEAPLVQVHRVDVTDIDSVYQRDMTRDVTAYVWESAMEGVAGLALDLRDLRELEGLPGALEYQAIEGLAGATRDINRLAGIVEAFRRDLPKVAILWSDSSRILDDGEEHLASLRRAYEGTSFVGQKVRFLSETQLAAGEIEGIQLVILPRTPSLSKVAFRSLQEMIGSGLAMIHSTMSIPYDSRGRSQEDVLVYGPNTTLVRGADASTEYMEAVDEAVSRGRIPDIPRVINRFGFPIEGIKTRYVEMDGTGFLYVINLRKDSFVCNLSIGPAVGWDLIGEREIDFPRTIDPLRPMLIRLSTPGSSEKDLNA